MTENSEVRMDEAGAGVDPDELYYEKTEEEPEEEALDGPKFEIFSYPADTTLKGYLEQWNNSQLEIPPFQREYVWDQTRASKLIESFLLGLPVPPVFLYKESGRKSFWIIDGNQRIHSLVYFQKGIFGEGRFRLKGVDPRWVGKMIEDLSDEDRFNLETSVLRAVVIQQTNPSDYASIYQIFERLNTGGIRLNAMEVRQCVYISDFIKGIKRLNELPEWRELIGTKKPDKRLKDVELVLRVIALFRDFENYEKPMKGFLNECAVHFKSKEKNNGKDASEEEEMVYRKFKSACQCIRSKIGEKPFHLRGRLNYSVLDAVMVSIMRNGEPSDFETKYFDLTKDDLFLKSVSYNTSDESVIAERMNITLRYMS